MEQWNEVFSFVTFLQKSEAYLFFQGRNASSFVGVASFHHLSCVSHCHIHSTIRYWFIICKSLILNSPYFLLIMTMLQFQTHWLLSFALCLWERNIILMLSIALRIYFGNKNKDTKYIDFANKITFTKTPQSAIDRLLVYHLDKTSCISFINSL
jgi:hypothetical protein